MFNEKMGKILYYVLIVGLIICFLFRKKIVDFVNKLCFSKKEPVKEPFEEPFEKETKEEKPIENKTKTPPQVIETPHFKGNLKANIQTNMINKHLEIEEYEQTQDVNTETPPQVIEQPVIEEIKEPEEKKNE
jgi:flagellar basal body-associated protein FliL